MTTDWSDGRPDDPRGSGERDPEPDPRADLQPPDEELWVARTLADQPDPTLPRELGRQLDARLAALVAERRTEVGGSGADPRPAAAAALRARRRRRWPQALLAAAAVLAGGYAVGTGVVGSLAGTGAGESSSAGDAGADAEGGSTEDSAEGPAAVSDLRRLSVSTVALRSEHLRADVRRLLAAGDQGTNDDRAGEELAAECAAPAVRAAVTVWLVQFDGGPAVLATSPRDGRVRATVYSCDTAPLASITVRAP